MVSRVVDRAPREPMASLAQGVAGRIGRLWPAHLKDHRIETCIHENRATIAHDAAAADVDQGDLERQVRLHLPAVPAGLMDCENFAAAYDMVRIIAVTRAARIRQAQIQAELKANASLFYPKTYRGSRDLTLVAENDGARIPLRFGPVRPSIGYAYQADLHYLRAARGDSYYHYGLFLPGADYPITYVGLSSCDRPYITEGLSSVRVDTRRTSCLILTRMYGLPGIPTNLMSMTIRQLIRRLRLAGSANLLLTAYNPLLGFSGTAYTASGFTPYALAPVTYAYNERGEFTTRRKGNISSLAGHDTPPNVLMARGIHRKKQRELSTLVQLTNISSRSYRENAVQQEPMASPRSPEWLARLRGYRAMLEPNWSTETAHPSYLNRPAELPASTGQCGVTSVWLARELRHRFGIEATYCVGDMLFSDGVHAPVPHHCWVEVGDPADPQRLVIDLTCDQSAAFRDEQILCGSYSELRYRCVDYQVRTRLSIDQLPTDRVWHRFKVLDDAVAAERM